MIHVPKASPLPDSSFQLPVWAKQTGLARSETDSGFLVGAASLALDRLIRAEPVWGGVWRQRLAMKSAVVAVRLTGRRESEPDLRDAWVMRKSGDDLGPSGHLYGAWKRLAAGRVPLAPDALNEICAALGVGWRDELEAVPDWLSTVSAQTLSPSLAAAQMVLRIHSLGNAYEVLALWMADRMLQEMMNWPVAVPIFMSQRYSPHFRLDASQKRMTTDHPGFAHALSLAYVDGVSDALRLAAEIERRALKLLDVTPKLRAKGAGDALHLLLNEEAVSGSLSTAKLSRFASRRLFDRLLSFGAVRELSGRPHFRVFGI